jgi:hypothetical protein
MVLLNTTTSPTLHPLRHIKEIEARTRQHDPDRERRERMCQEEALDEVLPRCEWLPANQR